MQKSTFQGSTPRQRIIQVIRLLQCFWNQKWQRMKMQQWKKKDKTFEADDLHVSVQHLFSLFESLKWGRLRSEVLLQERNSLQVLFDYRVHNHLEHDLDVGGVCGCGEVVVDEFAGRGIERDERGSNEAGRRIHIAVCTWGREMILYLCKSTNALMWTHSMHKLQLKYRSVYLSSTVKYIWHY